MSDFVPVCKLSTVFPMVDFFDVYYISLSQAIRGY